MDPDPDPDRSPASTSGSGSGKNEYGSETLVSRNHSDYIYVEEAGEGSGMGHCLIGGTGSGCSHMKSFNKFYNY